MPPKTCICSICGKEVMKSQTYATGQVDSEGVPLRACKEHEGVLAKKDELQERQKTKAEQALKNLHKPKFSSYHNNWAEKAESDRDWLNSHCWLCGQEALHYDCWPQLMLLASEVACQAGILPLGNDFNNIIKKTLKHLNIKRWIFRIVANEEQCKILSQWKGRFQKIAYPLLQLGLEVVFLCPECQKRIGIIFEFPETKPIDLDTALLLGATYRESEAHQINKVIAEKILVKDNVLRTQSN